MAAIYFSAGFLHLILPEPFLKITPSWVPAPELVVKLTGIAELAGAVGLLIPKCWISWARTASGSALALYALCVWPANINHFMMDMAQPDHGLGLAYHIPRMIAQPIFIWWALWVGRVTNWPFRTPAP